MIELSEAPADLAPGTRVYAIGDVHGCLERLLALHAAIAADLAARPVADPLLLHVGDYIDRGPDSAQVIATLLDGPAVQGARVVNLTGNHEAMMLAAIDAAEDSLAGIWLENGGAESLLSWGIGHRSPRAEWADKLPPAHLAFLRALAACHREGNYVFVHAGLRPGQPLDRQDRHDMLWIREPFLSYRGAWRFDGDPGTGDGADPREGSDTRQGAGGVVVHGHTPRRAPVVRSNRIGIDTGAVYGGDLTCLVLEADRIGFLTA